MSMDVKIYKQEADGRRDITELLPSYSWSGDYKSCSRELSFNMLQPLRGSDVPLVPIAPGDQITMDVDGVTQFAGTVVTVSRTSDGSSIDLRCFDRGRILKRNTATYQFKNTTPEAAAARVCVDFGIEVGELAATGIPITRNFVAVDIYSIIQTMYTLASEQTKEKYIARFEGLKFCVLQKKKPADPVRIAADVNIQSLSVKNSIEKLVNRVEIIDKNGNVKDTQEDADSIAKYGRFTDQIKESDTAAQKAAQALSDGGPSQTITVNNMGDLRALTGTVIEVREPTTGIVGEFYVDSDTHTWKRGQYYNKLTLNFKNIMDEKSSGKEA